MSSWLSGRRRAGMMRSPEFCQTPQIFELGHRHAASDPSPHPVCPPNAPRGSNRAPACPTEPRRNRPKRTNETGRLRFATPFTTMLYTFASIPRHARGRWFESNIAHCNRLKIQHLDGLYRSAPRNGAPACNLAPRLGRIPTRWAGNRTSGNTEDRTGGPGTR